MLIRIFTLLLFFSYSLFSLKAQTPEKLTSNQIYEKIEKLNFLGTVLYVAAHPDDENTRLISYLSNQVKARTVYLSLTRGDGGQNLIGPEIRESLGVIRTQELLAARRIDGGEQRFSRANDFGYSKHPDETLDIWDKEKIVSDVVWAIRTLKPDIIINRFDHRTSGTTHGHHTASAMLSVQAFDMAADKNAFPEQLTYVDLWNSKRMYFNTSWWFYGSQKKFKEANKENLTTFDIGVYYPQKGLSNNEIAAVASSQHLCQGFGRLSTRGSQSEYIEFIKGDRSKDNSDLFSGIDTSWNRVKGGKEIGKIVKSVLAEFNFKNPSIHLPVLMEAYEKVRLLEDNHWRVLKEKELSEIIYACAGLYIEVTSTETSATPNGKVDVTIEVLNRSNASVHLNALTYLPSGKKEIKNIDLLENLKLEFKEKIILQNEKITSPYWLDNLGDIGMYTVNDQKLIGLPNTPRNLKVDFEMEIEGTSIVFSKELVCRFSKRDKGELYQPFEVLPKVTVSMKNPVVVFSDNKKKEIEVEVTARENEIFGILELLHKEGWQTEPSSFQFSLDKKGASKQFKFLLSPPKNQSESEISIKATVDGKIYDKELVTISYDHIPTQSVLKPSTAKVVRMNIKKKGDCIGYVKGAGDKIPESLSQIGYEVAIISPENITEDNLEKFDAIVMGIRAYNTVEELGLKQSVLLQYVEKGGNLIVQYNTTGRRSGIDVKAPYSLTLSRDRVTDENSVVTFLDPKHPLLRSPNSITVKDFEGWVQERGLYFPNKWSVEFTPILAMNDKGETSKYGSILVAQYGKGQYIYTGLSFFRELPAAVPGAYKLFANMLSYKK